MEPIGKGDKITLIQPVPDSRIIFGAIYTCDGIFDMPPIGRHCAVCNYYGSGLLIHELPSGKDECWCPNHWRVVSRRSGFEKILETLKGPAPKEPVKPKVVEIA